MSIELRRRLMGSKREQLNAKKLVAPVDFDVNNQDINIISIFNKTNQHSKSYIYSIISNEEHTHVLPKPIGVNGYIIGENDNKIKLDGTVESYTFSAGSNRRYVIVLGDIVTGSYSEGAVWLFTGNCTRIESMSATTLKYVYYSYLTYVNFNKGQSNTSFEGECILPCNVGQNCFRGSSKITAITILNSVTDLSNRAFYGCGITGNVYIPDSIKYIGDYTFYNCPIISISVPNVSRIGINSLNSSKLTEFEYRGSSYEWQNVSIESILFTNSTYFYTYENGEKTLLENVTLRSDRDDVGSYKFANIKSLKNITITSSVKKINKYAFFGCSNLSGDFNNFQDITYIGNYAFDGCTNLKTTDIILSNKVTIGIYAFNNCKQLEGDLTLSSINRLEDYAFYGCSKLKNLTFSNNISYIGNNSCAKTSVSNNVNLYSCKVFYCTFLDNTPITTLGGDIYIDYSFNEFMLTASNGTMGSLWEKTRLYANSELIEGDIKITGVDSKTTITACLRGYNMINSVEIENIKKISNRAMVDSSANLFVIDDKIEELEDYTIANQTNVYDVIINKSTPFTIKSTSFGYYANIYVPNESVETYKAAWSTFADRIKPISEYTK